MKASRVGVYKGRIVPVCAICHRGIFHSFTGTEMHEALITRGNVRGNKALLRAIMVDENCVLVHPGPCHKKAHTEKGRLQCLKMLISYEGEEKIRTFLMDMLQLMATPLAEERLSLIE